MPLFAPVTMTVFLELRASRRFGKMRPLRDQGDDVDGSHRRNFLILSI